MIQRISKILLIMSFAFFTMALPPRCFAEIVNQPAADAGFQVDNSALSGISNPDQSITNNPAPEIDNDYPCQKIRNPKVPRVKNRSQGIDNDNSGKIKNRNRTISNPEAGNIANLDQGISNPETANVINRDQRINNPQAGNIENPDSEIRNNTPGISNPEAPRIANSNGSIFNSDQFISNGDHRIKNGDHFLINFDWSFLGVFNWDCWNQPFFLM